MNPSTSKSQRRFRTFSALWATVPVAIVTAAVTASALWAQIPAANVFRIEEDWQLVIGSPDTFVNGPQVTCTISPINMSTAYCAFDINYHTQPDYQAGGLQIHTWDPTNPVEIANADQTHLMSTAGETVTWTQTMALANGALTFKIMNGQSQTWGKFGGAPGNSGDLMLNLPSTLSNLNSYSSGISVANSGVSFATNYVTSLTLAAVRYYDVNGNLIQQITTPQVVYPHP